MKTLTRIAPAVIAAALAAGCAAGSAETEAGVGDGGGAGSVTVTSSPDSHRARAVADHEFGLLSGGGWGAAWDLWTASAQHAVSRADFVRVDSACRPWLGQPFTVEEVGWPSIGRFTVTWEHAGISGTSAVLFQDGAWRFQPDPATLAIYGSGVAAALATLREQQACRA